MVKVHPKDVEFVVNREKSHLHPAQELKFLGLLLSESPTQTAHQKDTRLAGELHQKDNPKALPKLNAASQGLLVALHFLQAQGLYKETCRSYFRGIMTTIGVIHGSTREAELVVEPHEPLEW